MKSSEPEKLIRDIKYQKYKSSDHYVILNNLLKKGYSKEEILEEYDKIPLKKEWNGSMFGFLFLIFAVFIIFNIHSTFGDFNFKLLSSGDWLRFNEWVFKPFFILSFFLTGILVLVDRGYLNRQTKYFLATIAGLEAFLAAFSNDINSFLIGLLALVFVLFYPIRKENKEVTTRRILDDIDGKMVYKNVYTKIIKQAQGKVWNGSAIFILFLFIEVLFFNSNVRSSLPFQQKGIYPSQIEYENYLNSLPFIDHFLTWMIKVSLLLVFITAIILMINVKKAKYLLSFSLVTSVIIIIGSLLHEVRQDVIYPALMLFVTSLYLLKKYKLLDFHELKNK